MESCQNEIRVLKPPLLQKELAQVPSRPFDVQWTSVERPYLWTCGCPKGTFNERLVDIPNETQLVRPNRTKIDVHGLKWTSSSRDAMHGTWTSSGPPLDVY